VIGEVDRRISIEGKFIPNVSNSKSPTVSHSYELKIDGINLSVACTVEGKFCTFYTTDNLLRVATLLTKKSYQQYNTDTLKYDAAAKDVLERINPNSLLEIQEPAG